MHIVIAGLYSAIIYLSLLAYMVIVGLHPGWVLVTGPVIISGLIAALITAEIFVAWLSKGARWMWRSLGTVRLRRSVGDPAAE